MVGGRFGWCKAPSQQKLVDVGGLAAGSKTAGAAKVEKKENEKRFFLSFLLFLFIVLREEVEEKKLTLLFPFFLSFFFLLLQKPKTPKPGLRRRTSPCLRQLPLDELRGDDGGGGESGSSSERKREGKQLGRRRFPLRASRRLRHPRAAGRRRQRRRHQLLLRPALYGGLVHRYHADGGADVLGVRVSVLRRREEDKRRSGADGVDLFPSDSTTEAPAAAAAEAGDCPRRFSSSSFFSPTRRPLPAPDEVREVRGRARGAAAAEGNGSAGGSPAPPRLGLDAAFFFERNDKPFRVFLPGAAAAGLGRGRAAAAAAAGCCVARPRRRRALIVFYLTFLFFFK